MPRFNVVGVFDESGQQGFIRKNIDAAHQAVGRTCNEFDGARRENVRAVVTRRAHPEHQIIFQYIARQRLHVEMMRDAILELAHVRLIQFGVQFRLPEQDDLQQFGIADLQVVQQPQFFQCVRRHGMSLIHQHDDAFSLAGFFLELVLDILHDDADTLAFNVQPKPIGNRI